MPLLGEMKSMKLARRFYLQRKWLLMGVVLLSILVCVFLLFNPFKNRGEIPLIVMVRIEGGEFLMGSETGEADEKPVHRVRVGSFYLSRTEVTVGQWRKFIEDTGYITMAEKGSGGLVKVGKRLKYKADANWKNPYLSQTDDHPVVLISWHDARAFCRWLSKKTGLGYRLPTEAEWEFACQGGTTGDGHGDLDSVAWYEYNSAGETHPVAQKQPNAFGLYDMLGNVWEWCHDYYGKNYYAVSPTNNPPGPYPGKQRVNRGGSWCSQPPRLRASFRKHDSPVFCFYRLGFRIARSL